MKIKSQIRRKYNSYSYFHLFFVYTKSYVVAAFFVFQLFCIFLLVFELLQYNFISVIIEDTIITVKNEEDQDTRDNFILGFLKKLKLMKKRQKNGINAKRKKKDKEGPNKKEKKEKNHYN